MESSIELEGGSRATNTWIDETENNRDSLCDQVEDFNRPSEASGVYIETVQISTRVLLFRHFLTKFYPPSSKPVICHHLLGHRNRHSNLWYLRWPRGGEVLRWQRHNFGHDSTSILVIQAIV